MSPAPIAACDVQFDEGVRLTGYSLRLSHDVAWLRLRWLAPRGLDSRLRFFGHAVATQSPEAPILLSFDHDLGFEKMPQRRGNDSFVVVQDILRDVSKLGAEAKFVRAGVFDIDKPLDRLAVRSSSLPMSSQQKALYLPLPRP